MCETQFYCLSTTTFFLEVIKHERQHRIQLESHVDEMIFMAVGPDSDLFF